MGWFQRLFIKDEAGFGICMLPDGGWQEEAEKENWGVMFGD